MNRPDRAPPRSRSRSGSRTLSALIAAALLAAPVGAQQRPAGAPEVSLGGGFRTPIHDGNRLIALVSGRDVKPALAAGQVLIGSFRLETYRYSPDRQTDLTIESPTATFDPKGAASDGDLVLRGADGRVSVLGRGWSWDRGSGLLTVSNTVRATLQRSRSATNTSPVEIESRRLEYNLKSGETRFIRDCIATEPGRARITAGELSSRLSTETERPDAITATNGVVVELLRPGKQGRASGASATYSATPNDGERIELHGSPEWEFGPGRGSADRLLLLPGQDAYQAAGHARLRLRSSSSRTALTNTAGTGPESQTAPPPRRDRAPLDISCETIDAHPGEVVFSGPLTLVQSNALHLTANRLVAELSGDTASGQAEDSLHRVTATGDVRARLPLGDTTAELAGQRMVYGTGEHAMIEVTGEPSWSSRGYQGTGGRFVIHPEVPSFQVVDGVDVQWAGTTNTPPAEVVRVRADRLLAESTSAQFRGQVVASRQSWKLAASEVDLTLATNAVLRSIDARDDVVLDYLAPIRLSDNTNASSGLRLSTLLRDASETGRNWTIRAATLHADVHPSTSDLTSLVASGRVRVQHVGVQAEGETLQYHSDDGRLRLGGEPRLETVDGLRIVGLPDTVLVLDPARNLFRVEGPVRSMTLPANTLRRKSSSSTTPAPRP